MTIRAIADLHLNYGDKPMDVFSDAWENHAEHIFLNWRDVVEPGDFVLVPGDISWAMRLADAKEHLEQIGGLPGYKVILRGNHDYWWSSVARVREALPQGMFALQNDSIFAGEWLIAGTRGWLFPTCQPLPPDDEKIYNRELIRLELSLKHARNRSMDAPIICMTHFPPLTPDRQSTAFTQIMRAYGVAHVVYGHLHGASLKGAFRGEMGGIEFHQVSADGIGFCPKRIAANL